MSDRDSLHSYPPGPPARRGLFAHLRYYAAFIKDPIGFVGSRFDQYGDVYYAPSRDEGLYVIKHPEHLRQVLVTHASCYRKTHSAFRQIARVVGNGLLTADGEVWRRHRRMIQPAFQKSRLRGYAAMMSEEAARQGERWRDGQRVDLGADMMALTLRIVSRSLFSYDVESDIGEVASVMHTLQNSITRPDLLPRWMPSRQRRQLQGAVAALDRLVYQMIERRRQTVMSTVEAPEGNDGRDGDGEAPRDLLAMLLTATDEEGGDEEAGLDDREIRDELVTLFLAGHETTAQALTWTWYLLSQHPEVEAALHAELDREFDDRSPTSRLTLEDLDALPYTEQILKESMRLYPPVYALGRRAHQDTCIGEYEVKSGSEVVIWIYMTHRDPRWYPEPDAFRPERFAPEAERALPKQAYAPFGAGARACIGKHFAMIEAKMILATLARRFRLELAPGQKIALKPRVTLVPRHGMKMLVRRRSSAQ